MRHGCLISTFVIGTSVLLAVAGCGGGGGGDTTVITQQTVTQTTPSNDGGGPGSESDGAGGSSGGGAGEAKIPDLVGERLDVAEDRLDGLGITYDEIGGGTFGIVVRSNWEVCETNPKAGSHANSVKLIVDRPDNC